MLTAETLSEIDDDALRLYAQAKANTDAPPSMDLLCRRLIGSAPTRARMAVEGACGRITLRTGEQRWSVQLLHRLTPARARFVCGHEIAEWWYRHRGAHLGLPLLELEARCDALGARLAAPRKAFERAVRTVGHRVHVLAAAFIVPQAVALLRVGEVTGRPVKLVRHPEIQRGEAFDFLAPGRDRFHQIRADERWGLMATRRPV